jgi:hypothetical protein
MMEPWISSGICQCEVVGFDEFDVMYRKDRADIERRDARRYEDNESRN